MRKGITIAGNLIVDYVKEIDSYPSQAMLGNIASVQQSVGGCVANTIVNLAKIGAEIDLAAIGMVGDDSNGKYIKKVLTKHNIDISGIGVTKEAMTSFTDVMTSDEGKVRTFFHARGANAIFDFEDIDFERIKSRFFHMGYALLLDGFDAKDEEYGTVMAKTLAAAKRYGLKTSMDVVSENGNRFRKVVTPSLKYCDNLIINEVEASMICNLPVRINKKLDKDCLRKVCGKLISCGVNERVIVHAPEAACAMTKDGEFVVVPSLLLPDGFIRGAVGAGDAFCAGVLYSLYKEYDLEYTLTIGAAAAACNLSELNSVDGMRSISLIVEMIKSYPRQET